MWLIAISLMLLLSLGGSALLALRLRRATRNAVELGGQLVTAEMRRSRLVQHLGHEVRNPLNAILGVTDEAAQDPSLSAERARDLQVLRSAANQLLMVSTNLLALHADEAKSLPAHVGLLAVPEMVAELREVVSPSVVEKGLRLDVQTEIGSPLQIESDAESLRLILLNVLSHAVGLTSEGVITVTLHAPASGGGQGELHVSVMDGGPSLVGPDSIRMFEPYGLESRLQSTVAAGTGLNLFVARKLARSLDGDVQHRPHPNGGNVYELRVPATVFAVHNAESANPPKVVAFNGVYVHHRKTIPTQHILAIEDQRSNQHLIQTILTRAGHTVEMASNGEEGLALLERNRYDLVMVDLRMPKLNGLDLMRRAQITGLQKRELPYIVLTGEVDVEIQQACTVAGAAAFLAKPIVAERLLDTIAAVVRRKDRLPAGGTLLRDDLDAPSATVMASLTPRMVGEFLQDMARYTDEIERATDAGDVTKVRAVLRSVRGAAHTVGARVLSETCTGLLGLPDPELRATGARTLTQTVTHTTRALTDIVARLEA